MLLQLSIKHQTSLFGLHLQVSVISLLSSSGFLSCVSVAAAGAFPMIYMMWAAAPFVAYVHIKLPLFARRSRDQLLRWAENIPPNTEVDLTTIKAYGRPRVSRMLLSDLRPVKARFGIENMVRVSKVPASRPRPWWSSKQKSLFFVGNERKRTVETVIWQKVWSQIQHSRDRSMKCS